MAEQKKPEQESFYEVHVNKNNELMISIRARDVLPSSPLILYDGGEHALLYRTPENAVVLDFLHPEVRRLLQKASSVLIAEVKEGKVLREFYAPCRQVKNLPLDRKTLKPLLSRSDALKIDERNLYQSKAE